VDFAVHADALSAEADNRLGDLIQYAIDGEAGANFVPVKGRITAAEPAAGWQAQDEAQGVWRLRIAKDVVPQPSKRDRLTCAPILGADTYRPMSKNPIDDGRYWLVDIQRV
jgi:hypothetical protein